MTVVAGVDRTSLLSHRLRGFDIYESSLAGLEAALLLQLPHVEVDVRVGADGEFIVAHDPFLTTTDNKVVFIHNLPSNELTDLSLSHTPPLLATMLDRFAELADSGTTFHIDIKDSGAESRLVDLIRRSGLIERTVVVSWIPSVLYRVHELEPRIRLCFSHLSFSRFPWMARFHWIVRLTSPAASVVYPFAKSYASFIRSLKVDCIDENASDLPMQESVGELYAQAYRHEVGERMRKLLSAQRGYVCLPTFLATQDLIDCYRSHGIMTAVFSISSGRQLDKIASRIRPDIWYVDEASLLGPGEEAE